MSPSKRKFGADDLAETFAWASCISMLIVVIPVVIILILFIWGC